MHTAPQSSLIRPNRQGLPGVCLLPWADLSDVFFSPAPGPAPLAQPDLGLHQPDPWPLAVSGRATPEPLEPGPVERESPDRAVRIPHPAYVRIPHMPTETRPGLAAAAMPDKETGYAHAPAHEP